MHLVHLAPCLEQGRCSRNVTGFGVWGELGAFDSV